VDPDTAFFPNCGSGSSSESGVLMTKKWIKLTTEKKLDTFLIKKIAI
jgi:hypothetical protein